MTTQGIPLKRIKVGVLHEEIPNPMREWYDKGVIQGQERGVAFALAKFKDILERMAENTPIDDLPHVDYGKTIGIPMPPDDSLALYVNALRKIASCESVVQAGGGLVDNAMKDLLNHECLPYFDYLTIGMIEA